MNRIATLADMQAAAAPQSWDECVKERTVYERLCTTASENAGRNALSFQIKSGPNDPAETLTWDELKSRTTQTANMFRSLGVHEGDVVAYLLPNCNETVLTFLGAVTAGIVCPINPTLHPDQIASILRETGAKIVVTLAPFPKSDVAETAAQAVARAPNVETVIEVDLKRYLKPPLAWIVPLIRPKRKTLHRAVTKDFWDELNKADATLGFSEDTSDRICANFHTGGTTGMPKIVQHRHSGMLYQGWAAECVIVGAEDVLICPLPMFHVFAAYPILMACVKTGAHMVMPTPAGYRGDGVMDNYWKLVERWGVTFMVTVPTAVSALMQRPVNADISSLKYAFCGSAPLPVELFKRFQEATGVNILEGYGMTETTCLISGNPPFGEKKIGSVGFPFPYTDLRIFHCDEAGNITKECGPNEVGEICVSNPGVITGHTYTEMAKNNGLFAGGTHLRTGDLGRIDEDGYVWITGRAKDLIIRGGHNIDPAVIEEVLAGHPQVAFAGAIGQPDQHAGELPCAYVELIDGGDVSVDELMEFAASAIPERAAIPKHLEVLDELPKTAVGKIFKPDLRKLAIERVYSAAAGEAQLPVTVLGVQEVKGRGLVAILEKTGPCEDDAVHDVLGLFARPWQWDEKPDGS